ncbi:MAG: valine--tRNA ligase [Selenomonadaceae bacterium]|nr:valine--tRNA ligase [Selenomonadaceae bacterium]
MELNTKYNPAEVEDKWYAYWLKNRCFHSEPDSREPYTIVIPPPNVTGILHMGHVLNNTLNDVLIRKARMDGKNACWVPGTDHASIATESKVVARLKEKGISKDDLTREEFLKYAWEWKEEHGGIILQQLRKLGASCDWDRTKFTMEPALSDAVTATFVYFYKKGLIYHGYRMVNWDPVAHTAISDDEVIHKDTKSHFYHLRYFISDGKGNPTDEFLTIATTRPETIMADAAICVNPADERYHWLRGKKVLIPLINKEIPVIEDSYVEMDFGTGCLKVTPAHDANDYAIGQRHNLPILEILDDDGKLNGNAQILVGEDRFAARKKICKMLEDAGNLVKVEEYISPVGYSERTDAVIEPKLSKQWFLKLEDLAKAALESVESGKIKLIPDKYRNVYRHWMENAHDWCISRQLWWGQRIPAWYLPDGSVVVEEDEKKALEAARAINPAIGPDDLRQDEDVLDTWFSSGLWPFETMGWPEETEELRHFYPTSTLVTGYDIIFFWVARMVMMGLEFGKDIPFRHVFIHGLVRDSQGRKMSKSLGNGIDPVEVVDKYGADTLRFMLITGNTPGNDMRFYWERVESARNFANKIWNASRYMLMNLEGFDRGFVPKEEDYTLADRWILSRYARTAREVTENLEKFELGEAGRMIYEFIWSEFCDWYIELTKSRLYDKDHERPRQTALYVLGYVLEHTLRLLHPFMPFITEEIWQKLPHEGKSIMIAAWPEGEEAKLDDEAEKQMTAIMETIKTIRNMRTEVNAVPGKKSEVILHLPDESLRQVFSENEGYLVSLASAEPVTILGADAAKPENAMAGVANGVEIYLPLKGLIDVEKEMARLKKDAEKLEKEIGRLSAKLENPGFLSKAPEHVVSSEREKLAGYEEKKKSVEERLEYLAGI